MRLEEGRRSLDRINRINRIRGTLSWTFLLSFPYWGIEGAEPIKVKGTWVLDSDGHSIPVHLEARPRGLQPSGLLFRNGELWSVGDQRSEFPGHLLRIDTKTDRLIGKPIRLEPPALAEKENPEFAVYRSIPNSDFEGLVTHPLDSNILFAITEDKTPWIVEIRLEEAETMKAKIVQLTPINLPVGVKPWRDNPNFRWEGLAVSDDGKTMYLAFERAQDDLPRIYHLSLEAACSGKAADPEEVPLPFAQLPRRPDKEQALLNVNDIQFLRLEGRTALLSIARDQERLLLIDLEQKRFPRVIDLDLVDPSGGLMEWVSPEGLAFDIATDRLWIINDPDSERRNYRARNETIPTGQFADYTPLLFEMKLSAAIRAPAQGK